MSLALLAKQARTLVAARIARQAPVASLSFGGDVATESSRDASVVMLTEEELEMWKGGKADASIAAFSALGSPEAGYARDVSAKAGKVSLIHPSGGDASAAAKRVIVAGLGPEAKCNEAVSTSAAVAVASKLRELSSVDPGVLAKGTKA